MCAQELSRSFQNQCFFCLWSPAGSQAVEGVVFGLQLVADPLLWVHAWGQPATDPVECSPRSFLSVLPGSRVLIRAPAHLGFQVWAPRRAPAGLQVSARAAFPRSQSRAEGGGAPEAWPAAESSLTSYYVPLLSFPF